MSYIGAGGEDWVELDFDLFERERLHRLESLVTEGADRLRQLVGRDFELEPIDSGGAYLVAGGRRRFRAEVGPDDRLVLTGILDPDGPL